jgi:hypothetical protein
MRKIKKPLMMLTALLALCLVLCSCSESCARSCKDFNSDYNGGLHRTVKVYDIDGDLVAEYTGKFDIETDHSTYILWDDEMGKRHIIYFSTFNVIIDEN